MKKQWIATVSLLIVATTSLATLPVAEPEFAADGGAYLFPGSEDGATGVLSAKAFSGDAGIVFFSLDYSASYANGRVLRRWPVTGLFKLAADEPRPFDMTGSLPDSFHVELDSAVPAEKVRVTW